MKFLPDTRVKIRQICQSRQPPYRSERNDPSTPRKSSDPIWNSQTQKLRKCVFFRKQNILDIINYGNVCGTNDTHANRDTE